MKHALFRFTECYGLPSNYNRMPFNRLQHNEIMKLSIPQFKIALYYLYEI